MATEHEKLPLEQDQRPAYEPPTCLPFGDMQVGSGGAVCMTGSGNAATCVDGLRPGAGCGGGSLVPPP